MKKIKHDLIVNERVLSISGILSDWVYLKDVEPIHYGKTVRRVIAVKCKCGRIKEVQYNNIRNGASLCCGFSPCKIPINKNSRSIETTYNSLFYAYSAGAKKRNYSFDLTLDEFKGYLDKNCYYCNSKPSSVYQIKDSKTGKIRAGLPLIYNGIDRLNNKIGYNIKNCITCCETCNRMKMKYDYDFFLNHIKKIFNNKIKNNESNSTC